MKEETKEFLSLIFWGLKLVVLALIVVIPIRFFIFQPFVVRGNSMEPNFSQSDYLIIDEITYRFREPKRGEVVVFKYPYAPSQKFIKRIIGLPDEKIKIKENKIIIIKDNKEEILDESNYLVSSSVFPNGFEVFLKNDEYFVLGDNRLVSYDSREWGVLPQKYIIGRAVSRLWPINSMSIFAAPNYGF